MCKLTTVDVMSALTDEFLVSILMALQLSAAVYAYCDSSHSRRRDLQRHNDRYLNEHMTDRTVMLVDIIRLLTRDCINANALLLI